MATVNVKPLGDRVLVQPLEEQEVKKGGIIIPDTAKEKPQEGKVVALGTGKVDDNGKRVDFTVKKGDRVLISKYGGTEIKIDNENYLIMREDDILGIIGEIVSQLSTKNYQLRIWQLNNYNSMKMRGTRCCAVLRNWRRPSRPPSDRAVAMLFSTRNSAAPPSPM